MFDSPSLDLKALNNYGLKPHLVHVITSIGLCLKLTNKYTISYSFSLSFSNISFISFERFTICKFFGSSFLRLSIGLFLVIL